MAECLLDLIWQHGVPQRIIHDKTAEFLADVLQKTAHFMRITQLPTSGGHPQANSLVEHLTRTFKQMLCKLVNTKGRNFDKLLGGVLFAYRTTPNQSTGEVHFTFCTVERQIYPPNWICQCQYLDFQWLSWTMGKHWLRNLKKHEQLQERMLQQLSDNRRVTTIKQLRTADLKQET